MAWLKKKKPTADSEPTALGAVRHEIINRDAADGRRQGNATLNDPSGYDLGLTEQTPSPGAVGGQVAVRNQTEERGFELLQSQGAHFFKPRAALNYAVRGYVIPRSYRISGRIASDRPVVINGEFVAGSISANRVFVAPTGCLGGMVDVDVLEVAGSAIGQVAAHVGVDVAPQGMVSGEIVSPQIRVSPGGRVVGARLRIGGSKD